MSFEINPVLAGTFDAPGYAPADNSASATSADDVSGPDPRRYTKFDRSDTDAGTASFSFSDLVDALNPLQHIPVVSSVYRAVTGETINPVSRITGDVLYGGIFGVASAVLSGASSVADAGLEAATGKDSGGLAMAALFGNDGSKNTTQVADAGNAASSGSGVTGASTTAAPASAATIPKMAMATTPMPAFVPATVEAAPAPQATQPAQIAQSTATPSSATAAFATSVAAETAHIHTQDTPPSIELASASAASTPAAAATGNPPAPGAVASAASAQGIPLAKARSLSKLPYGGVMNQPNKEAQDMALALSQGAPGMRMGHMIYTNRLMNKSHSLPPMLSSNAPPPSPVPVIAPPPVLPTAGFTSSSLAGPAASVNLAGAAPVANFRGMNVQSASLAGDSSPAPELMQDMMLKALSQYGHLASGAAGPGSMVNVIN